MLTLTRQGTAETSESRRWISALYKDKPRDPDYQTLESRMKTMLADAQKNFAEARSFKQQTYYRDMISALQGDLAVLKRYGRDGSRNERIAELKRLDRELNLELKYNVNLTGEGIRWSEKDLAEFESVMKLIGNRQLTTDSVLFSTVSLKKLPPGVGGYNYGDGRISLVPGGVSAHLIHEIGHNFENENPRWQEFKNLSGWRNVTGEFNAISGDYDSGGAYIPYDGSATLKNDGKIYRDGDRVDLDGDGSIDGIVRVQAKRVFVHSVDASFATNYSRTEPREDFAETFEEFFLRPEALKEKCPEKFEFMAAFVGRDPTVAWQRPILKV